jgi:hypothetical protein
VPWCPNCHSEYQPGFEVCSKCNLALVDEEPPREMPPSKSIADTAFWKALQPGWQIVRQSLAFLPRARWLLLAILVLVSLEVAGRIVASSIVRSASSRTNYQYQLNNPEYINPPFSERWLLGLRSESFKYVVDRFATPFILPTSAASQWFEAGNVLLLKKTGYLASAQKGMVNLPWWQWAIFYGEQPIGLLIVHGIEAILLGWIFVIVIGAAGFSWRAALRTYWLRLFILALCIVIVETVILQLITKAGFLPSLGRTLDPSTALLLSYYSRWLRPFALVLLVFAPFFIVGQNLGAWRAVKRSVRFLWQWPVLVIFMVWRVVVEVVRLVKVAVPEPSPYFPLSPAVILNLWIFDLLFALLGVWLAVMLALLVIKDQQRMIGQT